jgi:peptidyl-prolyl cis-trans isomerase C
MDRLCSVDMILRSAEISPRGEMMRYVVLFRTAIFSLILAIAGIPLVGCGGGEEPAPTAPEEAESPVPGGLPGVGSEPPDLPGVLKAEDPEMVVAKVNGEPIAAGPVFQLAHIQKMRFLSEGQQVDEAMDKELVRVALQMVIDNELLAQAAQQSGLSLDPQEIDGEIEAARSQFPSEEEYADYLKNAGLTEQDVRQEAERRVMIRSYVKTLTDGKPVEDAIARKFYQDRPEMFTEGEQVRAAQILIRSAKDDAEGLREEARKRIDEAHARATGGEDFAELAKEYSQGPTAGKGGDIGFFPRGVMVPKFEEVAFSTPIGEISPVFETPYGFHIVKVLEKQEAKVKPYEEVKPWLMVDLARRKEAVALELKIRELRSGAKVDYLDPDLKPTEEAGS